MAAQNQSQTIHSLSETSRDIIFPPDYALSTHFVSLISEAEPELLYLGSETLTAALRKWKKTKGRRKSASEVGTMENAMMHLEAVEEVIRYLERLISKAEKKPLAPNLRAQGWFTEGDSIVSRLVESRDNYYISKLDYGVSSSDWARYASMPRSAGRVMKPRDNSSGVVAILLDDAPFLDPHLEYVDYCPFVLHRWEYDYLRANPDFFSFWCDFSHPDAKANLKTLIFG